MTKRPPRDPDKKTQPRGFGRVADREWRAFTNAARFAGMTRTAWMISRLMRAAKEEMEGRWREQ